MTCNLESLLDSACANGFDAVAQNDTQFKKLVLQLLYTASGTSSTLAELQADACTNGFFGAASNDEQFKKLFAQLLCEAI